MRGGTEKKIEEIQAMTSHPALRDSTRDVGRKSGEWGKLKPGRHRGDITDNGEVL